MNAVNACRLNDLDGKAGFWFVLQDLSVGQRAPFDSSSASSTLAAAQTRWCPKQFTVYSAKKFPGVVESTPL
ncbi:hypothetical protein A1F94_013835, partial [Pyrenophora tritici-repentis]